VSQSSSVIVAVCRIWWKPATLARMSSFPKCATQSATAWAHACDDAMSTDAKLPPGTSANTSAIREPSLAMPKTFAPRSANNRAVVAPRPADAPVTNATLPLS